MATIACVVAVAALFRAGQAFLVVTVLWNAVIGLLLTHDVREWPHRLQELLFYCVYVCKMCFTGRGASLRGHDSEPLRRITEMRTLAVWRSQKSKTFYCNYSR